MVHEQRREEETGLSDFEGFVIDGKSVLCIARRMGVEVHWGETV